MRHLAIGIFLGIFLATAFSAMAQWIPYDSSLDQRNALMKQELYLQQQRALDRIDQSLYSDPLLAMPGGPCGK